MLVRELRKNWKIQWNCAIYHNKANQTSISIQESAQSSFYFVHDPIQWDYWYAHAIIMIHDLQQLNNQCSTEKNPPRMCTDFQFSSKIVLQPKPKLNANRFQKKDFSFFCDFHLLCYVTGIFITIFYCYYLLTKQIKIWLFLQ